MPKFKHSTLIFISGAIWFAIGISLLTLGLELLTKSIKVEGLPLLSFLSPFLGSSDNAAIFLLTLGLAIGYLKGRTVLAKSANRVINRISQASSPAPLSTLFSPAYCILIAVMMLLGMGIRFFGVPLDVRGFIDVAVGSALINGAMLYFRTGMQKKIICDKGSPS